MIIKKEYSENPFVKRKDRDNVAAKYTVVPKGHFDIYFSQ